MPGPPPPPPPQPNFTAPPPSNDRSALLKSIRGGAKLKKTITNDKSVPMIGKVSSGTGGGTGGSNSPNHTVNNSNVNSTSSSSNSLNMGDLFAGGMPKLRATGKFQNSNSKMGNMNVKSETNNNNNSSNSSSNRQAPEAVRNHVDNSNKLVTSQQSKGTLIKPNTIQNEIKKQMTASDNKHRGPPPPAPIRNIPASVSNQQQSSKALTLNPKNGYLQSQSNQNVGFLKQSSSLHRKAKSNTNVSSADTTDNTSLRQPAPIVNGYKSQPSLSLANSINNLSISTNRPVINHGKPNLAPKPPPTTLSLSSAANQNRRPPPPTLANGNGPKSTVSAATTNINRTQSMKHPLNETMDSNSIKFGTVRNLSAVIGNSLSPARQRTPLNSGGRPTAPPPSVPNTKTIRPPNHAPPPPPLPHHSTGGGTPTPPPPPPHRTTPVTMNQKQSTGGGLMAATPPPPPPPPRHSSMISGGGNSTINAATTTVSRKSTMDFSDRFKHMFHGIGTFPKPPPFQQVPKQYASKQGGSKQQAPLPPTIHHNNNILKFTDSDNTSTKSWNVSSSIY